MRQIKQIIKTYWQGQDVRHRKHFTHNITIGLSLMFLLLTFGYHFSWMESIDNIAFDILQKTETWCHENISSQNPRKQFFATISKIICPSAKTITQQNSSLHFIDISSEDYKKWNSPLVTPRYELARIVTDVASKEPHIIFLDVFLAPATIYTKQHLSVPVDKQGDDALRSTLIALKNTPGAPYILLPVVLDDDGNPRQTIMDDLVDNKRIFHVLPDTLQTDSDKTFRYWKLYDMAQGNDGQKPYPVWSVPLLTAVLSEGKLNELLKIGSDIQEHAQHIQNGQNVQESTATITLAGQQVTIPYPQKETTVNDEGSKISKLLPPETHELTYVQRIRYHLVPETTTAVRYGINHLKEDLPDLKNKIALIGSSAPEMEDIKETTVGKIPGMYVLGSAIQTLLNEQMPSRPPLVFTVSYVSIIILISAIAFTVLDNIAASVLVSSAIILIFLVPSWYVYIKYGWFINVYLPFVVMNIYALYYDIKDSLLAKGSRGKRRKTND